MVSKKYVLLVLYITLNLVRPHITSEQEEVNEVVPRRSRRKFSSHERSSNLGSPTDDQKLRRSNNGVTPTRSHSTSAEVDITLTTANSTSTPESTSRAYPPLDRRFRRVYNPDEVAVIENYPFMAALLVNDALWCGAVIIDRDKVLSAAHCLQLQYNNRFFREYVKMLTVRVGATNATAGGEVLRVSEIFFHPNYKPDTLEFNFAVLRLHRNLTLSKGSVIDKIQLSNERIVPVDHQITFLGWGSVLGTNGVGGEVLLQKLNLPIYDLADCQEIYGRKLVTRHNFCAGYITIPKNVCNHDAGGPAILDGQLIGILSFSSKRCDTPDHPAVFSSVGVVTDWINNLGEKKINLRNTAIKSHDAITN